MWGSTEPTDPLQSLCGHAMLAQGSQIQAYRKYRMGGGESMSEELLNLASYAIQNAETHMTAAQMPKAVKLLGGR